MLQSGSRFRAMRVVRIAAAIAMLAPALATGARAGEGVDFIVPDNDGYGIAECMKPGLDCGKTIADAWCEAHGHGHASAYGLSDDVTGTTTISTARTPPIAPGSVIIHCGD